MNIVNLVGRLGKDVELRQAGDNKVTSLSLATTDGFGDNKKTNWHNVSFWNKQAEALAKYCSTGSLFKLGYNPEQAMNETLKEIESRTGEINKRFNLIVKEK